MKLHFDSLSARYSIQSYDTGVITINERAYTKNLILSPNYLSDWEVESFDHLTTAHFERLLALKPELVILGTGDTLRFPAPALTAPLLNANIGVEVMNLAAACRTYNILVGEDRSVVAGMLFK